MLTIASVVTIATMSSAPDTVVPEHELEQPVTGNDLVDAMDEPAVKPGLEGDADDSEDVNHLHDTNSVGMNKLTGSPKYESDTLGADHGVKTPGYTDQDARLGKNGHYYIGPSRRRIGAGFGRRRAPPARLTPEKQDDADEALAPFGTPSPTSAPPPPPPFIKYEEKLNPPPPPTPSPKEQVKRLTALTRRRRYTSKYSTRRRSGSGGRYSSRRRGRGRGGGCRL